MRRMYLSALAFVLLAAACGDDSTSDATPAPAAPQPTAEPAVTTDASVASITGPAPTTAAATTPPTDAEPGARFAITALSITPSAQHVVIQNIGDAAGSLEGFAICQAPRYHSFDSIVLAPGEQLAVSLGGDVFLPPPGAQTTSAGIGTFSAADGEIGLYSRTDFGNSSAIVDYIEWGSSGHTRVVVAMGALIWNGGDFVPAAGGDSVFMFTVGQPTDGAEDWEFEVVAAP